jgi:thiol:disulfide interchange protein
MRRFVFVSLLFGLAAISAHGQATKKAPDSAKENLFQDLSYQDALTTAKKTKKVVMVELAKSTCERCKAMDAKTFPDKEVQQFIKDKAVAIKFTLDKEMDKIPRDLRKLILGKIQTPTIVFIAPDGKELGRTEGFLSVKEFLDKGKSIVK